VDIRWNWTGPACAAGLALAVLCAFAQDKDKDKGKEDRANPLRIAGKTLIAAEDLEWTALPGIPGAEQSKLAGDPAKGPHRAFFKYPVGLKSPVHTHTHGDRGVIVSGTLSLAVDGAPAMELPPGSFFSLGAGVKHVTAVVGEEPCVFYMEREGPFDVVVPEEAGGKRKQ